MLQLFLILSTAVGALWAAATPPGLFLYARAPVELVLSARAVGEYELEKYAKAEKDTANDEERMELQGRMFSKCSQIGAELFDPGLLSPPAAPSPVHRLVHTLGIDSVSEKFFSLPPKRLAPTLHSACLKNELQFQCTFGFTKDAARIRQDIEMIKQADANFRVMLDKECNAADTSESVFRCVHSYAASVLHRCGHSIVTYNKTRFEVNRRMRKLFQETVHIVKADMDRGGETEDALSKWGSLLERTLGKLAKVEASKCKEFSEAAGCVLEALDDLCGPSVAESFDTLLSEGYLARERGNYLNEQFEEFGVAPHRECLMI